MRKTVRELQKEQTKELLLKTAYEVFSKKGIMNTRVSDIAQAAGVSHGTIFVHFRSLEAMIEEVVALYGQKIAMRTHVLAQSSGSLSDLLHAHLGGIMEFEPFYTHLVIENKLLPPVRETAGFRSNPLFISFSLVYEREFGHNEDKASPCICCSSCGGVVHIISKTEIVCAGRECLRPLSGFSC
jgi:AcrR family transcriptional regulator